MAKRKEVEVEGVTEQISKGKLLDLLKDARGCYKEQRALSGDLGVAIKNAVEHDGLHRKAFSVIRGLDRMEAEKLADFLDAFNLYLELTGLADRAKSAPRLEVIEGGAS